jgi:hypothetical protein
MRPFNPNSLVLILESLKSEQIALGRAVNMQRFFDRHGLTLRFKLSKKFKPRPMILF